MCPKAYKLSAYFDGELKDRQRESLSKHILSCRACRSALRIFESQRKSLQGPHIEGGPDGYRRFWHYAGEAKLARMRGPMRVMIPLPLLVAALILIPILGVLNFVSRPIGGIPAIPHESTVITLSVSPDELESLLGYLEEEKANPELESIYTLPLPFTPLGDPLMVRSAAAGREP